MAVETQNDAHYRNRKVGKKYIDIEQTIVYK